MGTYLGIHPERATSVEKWLGRQPEFFMDYCRSKSSIADNISRLLIAAREAMEIPARAWILKMEEYFQTMSGTDLVTSAMTLFVYGLDFLIRSMKWLLCRRKSLLRQGLSWSLLDPRWI